MTFAFDTYYSLCISCTLMLHTLILIAIPICVFFVVYVCVVGLQV